MTNRFVGWMTGGLGSATPQTARPTIAASITAPVTTGTGRCQSWSRGAATVWTPSVTCLYTVADLESCHPDVRNTSPTLLCQTAPQQRDNRGGNPARQCCPVRLDVQHRGQDVGPGRAVKGPLTGQHLEQHDPKRPDVSPFVHRPAARLLGRHVRGRPQNDAVLGGLGGCSQVEVDRRIRYPAWRAHQTDRAQYLGGRSLRFCST